MLPLLLLLGAAPQMTAVDAERAFAADAQSLGQWTAFRKWAADDATMFVPEPINAQIWLKQRTDPPKAIAWFPTASYVACDGSMAVNTGGWTTPDRKAGYFSTVWRKQAAGGWKWTVDGGDGLKVARVKPVKPLVVAASCAGKPTAPPLRAYFEAGRGNGAGTSKDGTLSYQWHLGSNGFRDFHASIWTGTTWREVIDDNIPGSPANR